MTILPNKSNKLCVIPIYKEKMFLDENRSVEGYVNYFYKYDFFLIAPYRLNTDIYEGAYKEIEIMRFNDRYFKSNKTYNKIILNAKLYKCFDNYEYTLIAQTDATICNPKNDIMQFINLQYDYIGAPWYTPIVTNPYDMKDIIKKIMIRNLDDCVCGNRGFSLRKIDAFINTLEKDKLYLAFFWHFNENIYFTARARKVNPLFHVAPLSVAEHFALEEDMTERISQGKLPLALYAWKKYYPLYSTLNNALVSSGNMGGNRLDLYLPGQYRDNMLYIDFYTGRQVAA